MMQEKYTELLERLAPIADLARTQSLLVWDQRTMMSARGGAARAEQLATLATITHEMFTDPAIGHLLDDLRPFEESHPYDSDEASIIRVTRRDYEKLTKIPADLAAEISRARSLGQEAWVAARAASDFAQFQPFLRRNVELKHQYIECFDETDTPYDILLDDFEPGMKTSEVQTAFDTLKVGLVPLISEILAKADAVSDACLHGEFPVEVQEKFSHKVLERLGARWDSWRLDPTVHPFAGGSYDDIRITTRYNPKILTHSLFGTMHEFGHGLYEHQLSPALARTGLGDGASMSIHESQSRMWENLVGRSRYFWQGMYGELQATYPDQFKAVEMETFYRAINCVQPSFIRVEADEATYPLHIILRFELEQEIIAGKFPLRELPDAWNARFKEYLGLDVPNVAQGVLQDVHWSYGGMGYFPTYALGSIVACQLWEKIGAALPDVDAQIAAGDFAPLREWLRVNIHHHASKFTSSELLQRVLGSGIRVEPFLKYLQGKYAEIYNLAAA